MQQLRQPCDASANTGMFITESFAMWPGSSVCGHYFAHPESRYFSLGKIDRDQVADYAARKGMSVTEVERWLGPNLNYDLAAQTPESTSECPVSYAVGRGCGGKPGEVTVREGNTSSVTLTEIPIDGIERP
jgi:hypothetical protein